MSFQVYIPLCTALGKLISPLIEVIICDLKSNKIVFIEGNLSGQKIGESFLQDVRDYQVGEVINFQLNHSGKIIRSINVLLDESGEKNFLLCLNFDVSVLNQIQSLVSQFFNNPSQPEPKELLKNDWHERLHLVIHELLHSYGWSLTTLTNGQKKQVVEALFKNGAFNQKNAADYIAKILSMGRATIFNYLREWRRNEN
ncbi:helix-turn-helix transcriptional regulator [Candidatus Bodocaedibacter vickermanii]|uniref:Transcriptional regulator DauR n=1 Tax=Candidatus Bodocaedibacter vickermanii TaxID=2741701 RepID=A0A7L9RT73_9PROT|nr:Transcriptional regulator DauR [Candidatus Paracaedibacteraceae bacterium 'Lake Konstanz']